MRHPAARQVYLTFNAVSALLNGSIFTVYSLYFVTIAHLSPLELVLAGTALEISIFVFEIPTGIVADVYSRRLSILIGYFIIGLGFLVTGLLPFFGWILLGQMLWGLGYTFTSGASQAWISDEIGEENAGTAFLQATRLNNIGGVLGVFLTLLLSFSGVQAPIILGGTLYLLLSIYLLLFMPENGFRPTPAAERSSWQRMADTLRNGLNMVRKRPALGLILGIGFMYGLYSEGYDRLSAAHLLNRFTFQAWPEMVGWFALLNAGGMILSALALSWLEKRPPTRPHKIAAALLFSSTGIIAGLFTFALTHNFALAIATNLCIHMLRSINEPLYTAWVNHRLDSQVRATVLSFSSQVDAFGQIAGGPLIGLLAQRTDLQSGLLGSAFLLTPVLLLIALQLHRE